MESRMGVLIDFENLAAGTEREGLGRFDVRKVMRRLKDKGRILVARAYGDWGRFARFKQSLLLEGVTMVELTSFRGAEKNRADIALVVDAMELAHTHPHIDTFVLLSGDSDFTPLVMRLREMDRRVIGIGTRGSASRLIVGACDEFIFYDALVRGEPAPAVEEEEEVEAPPTLSLDEALALLVETVQGFQKEEAGPVPAGPLKQAMRRKAPAFDEGDYGFSSFARFLEAARDRGLVTLVRDDRAGGYRVAGADEVPAEEPEAAPAEEEEFRLPPAAERLRERLAADGLRLPSHLVRHTVVHELVDHVQERQARRKRNTVMYLYGDVARRCRSTDPRVPAREVRAVVDALKDAGGLVHSDGTPVQSPRAQFRLGGDAEELLELLRGWYVERLLATGADLEDALAVSWLLWNDDRHAEAARSLVRQVRDRLAGPGADEAPVAAAAEEAGPSTGHQAEAGEE